MDLWIYRTTAKEAHRRQAFPSLEWKSGKSLSAELDRALLQGNIFTYTTYVASLARSISNRTTATRLFIL